MSAAHSAGSPGPSSKRAGGGGDGVPACARGGYCGVVGRPGRPLPGVMLLRQRRGAGPIRDLIARAVLAALLVPQGMAYAEPAGMPPVTGLSATLVPLVASLVLGPSRVLVSGPDSAVSPRVAAPIVPLHWEDRRV